MFRFNRISHKPIKIDPIPDIEESIYYTLHSQKFYLQVGFPESSPLHGNVIIYQLNPRLENKEIWISNLGAQTQPPQQELIPLKILATPYIQLPPHGPSSGVQYNPHKLRHQTIIVTTIPIKKDHIITKSQI